MEDLGGGGDDGCAKGRVVEYCVVPKATLII